MKKEEAVQILKAAINSYNSFPKILEQLPGVEKRKEEHVEAMEMAIGALECMQGSEMFYKQRYDMIRRINETMEKSMQTYHKIFMQDQAELKRLKQRVAELESSR